MWCTPNLPKVSVDGRRVGPTDVEGTKHLCDQNIIFTTQGSSIESIKEVCGRSKAPKGAESDTASGGGKVARSTTIRALSVLRVLSASLVGSGPMGSRPALAGFVVVVGDRVGSLW